MSHLARGWNPRDKGARCMNSFTHSFRLGRAVLLLCIAATLQCTGHLASDDTDTSDERLFQPGTLSWIRPMDNQSVSGSILLEVSASRSAGRVSFALGGSGIATVTGDPPWTTTLDTILLSDGEHFLKATSRNPYRSEERRVGKE